MPSKTTAFLPLLWIVAVAMILTYAHSLQSASLRLLGFSLFWLGIGAWAHSFSRPREGRRTSIPSAPANTSPTQRDRPTASAKDPIESIQEALTQVMG